MNYKFIAYGGGGIFSILMDVVLPHALNLTDIENVYIEIQENEYGCPSNGFDFVFNQQVDESYKIVHCGALKYYKNNFTQIRMFLNKLKIKDEILSRVFRFDLGIHYRGIDMDEKHPNYGVFGFDDYKSKIDQVIKENPVKSIFVASDNVEAAMNVVSLYDMTIPTYFNINFIRTQSINESTFQTQVENSGYERFWKEAFIDMLTLSKCKYLLCRTSNFSNAAIAFSDTITKIYRL